MPKLNQIIAVANGTKGRTQKAITEIYHKLQKPQLLDGLTRRYAPKDEEGEQLPSEEKRIQVRVSETLKAISSTMTDLFDVVATQDVANCEAKANVVVGDEKILENVPVTHLLFLEKQLNDIHSMVDKLPTLDLAEQWIWSDDANCYATPQHETTRTKKVPRNHVKAEATKEHPAQVEVYHEDVVVGHWLTTKFSGAIPEKDKAILLGRVRKLQDSIRAAREEANSVEIEKIKFGNQVFRYLFGEYQD